jgi:hypothetical protein
MPKGARLIAVECGTAAGPESLDIGEGIAVTPKQRGLLRHGEIVSGMALES